MKRTDPQMKIRIPAEIKSWLERRAEANMRTMSAEIALALKERMKQEMPATAGE